MRKDRPLSELLRNEKVINKSITKEQVYKELVDLAFNEAYDTIETNVKNGYNQHKIGQFSRFQIRNEYYQAMIEKSCDLYFTSCDNEYGTQYFLVLPEIFETKTKNGFIGSKSTVSYTPFGKRFIADLQNRFNAEGIILKFIPFVNTTDGVKDVQIGVPFPTPAAYGGFKDANYYILYDIKH